MLPVALLLIGLGYLAGIAGQLRDPITMVLLAFAGCGALLAAAALRGGGAFTGRAVTGLVLLAAARTLQATKGTLIGNWPFALPAWVSAAGLVLVAAAALAAWRGQAPPPWPRLRTGFALAAAGSALIGVWLLARGNLLSFAPSLATTAGLAWAWVAVGRTPRPTTVPAAQRGGA